MSETGNTQASTPAAPAAPAPPPSVWPALRAQDARALIAFLADALGFEATVVYGDDDAVHHAELAWPLGGGVMLRTRDASQGRRLTPRVNAAG